MSIKLAIADDHQLFLDGLCSILESEIGVEIIGTAHNGLELLKLIESGKVPDVVLSDIRMPVMNGIILVKEIKQRYPELPVVALTMFDQETDVQEMLDAGARGYILKRSEKKELVRAIHTVARGDYYFSKRLQGIYEQWKQKEKHTTQKELTRRERQILELIARGKTSLQISQELNLSKLTVDTHRKNIHKKLGIKNNIALVHHAWQQLGIKGNDS